MTEKSISIIINILKTIVSLINDNYERFNIYLQSNQHIQETKILLEHKKFELLNNKVNETIKNILKEDFYVSLQEEYNSGLKELLEEQKKSNVKLKEILNEITITNSNITEKLQDIAYMFDELEKS